MENWVETIKNRIEEYNKETTQITACLAELANEIKRLNYNAKVEFNAGDISWAITINTKTEIVDYRQIWGDRKIPKLDSHGNSIGVEEADLKETLIKIILEKFKWLPAQK